MSVTQNEARPPYVTFHQHAVEDRNASIEAGHYMSKDVDFVHITPQGSKDCVELQADEWLQMIADEARKGRFNPDWVKSYKSMYEAYKDGQEIPLEGTSIKQWPPASKGVAENCIALGLRTVEDLAQANEEAIRRLGMGGRSLKQKAVDWLSASSNVGKVSEELSALRVRTETLEIENKDLKVKLKEIMAAAEALTAAKAAKP